MSNNLKWIRTTLAAGAAAAAFAGAGQAQLDEALNVARQSTQDGAQTQAQIDDIADRTDDLEREYLAILQQVEDQRVFVEQQRVFLQSQENELTELNRQLERVDTIERELTPMLLEMFVALEDFINSDIPFQTDMRMARLADIEGLLGDSQVSAAEKYRRLLNAYEIEASYGRSLRSYSEEVMRGDTPTEASILQIGRVAIIRRFGDGTMEMRTKDNPDWRPVPGAFATEVQRAFRIANEVTTPEVFTAPLPGPEQQ